MATVCDKCLVNMEKALRRCIENMKRKRAPIDGNVLHPEALSLYGDFSKGPLETCDTNPFTAGKGLSQRFRNRFGIVPSHVISGRGVRQQNKVF